MAVIVESELAKAVSNAFPEFQISSFEIKTEVGSLIEMTMTFFLTAEQEKAIFGRVVEKESV